MRTLCIIPARAGSKGIPGKNIIDVKGKPLISYSIQPAVQLKKQGRIDKVVVSTDSREIAETSLIYGAEVPFIRPAEISGDAAKSIDFIKHAIDFYSAAGEFFDAVLLLQPTSPLRTIEDIESALIIFENNHNNSLISVYREDYVTDLVMYKLSEDGITTVPLNPMHNKGVRRQEHDSTYVRNGCIYISSVALINSGFIIGENPIVYTMSKSRSVNVDNLEDLELLRKII